MVYRATTLPVSGAEDRNELALTGRVALHCA